MSFLEVDQCNPMANTFFKLTSMVLGRFDDTLKMRMSKWTILHVLSSPTRLNEFLIVKSMDEGRIMKKRRFLSQ